MWTDRLPAARPRARPAGRAGHLPHRRTTPRRWRCATSKGGDGPVIDWWLYEDVAKADPQGRGVRGHPVEEHTIDADRVRRDAPRLLRPGRPARRHGPQPHRAIAVLPVHHALRRADVPRGEGQGARAALRACLQRLDDRRVVRWLGRPAASRCASSRCGIPSAAAAEVRRNAARGCRAITFTEMPHHLGLPSIHDPSRYWDPLFASVRRDGHRACACTSARARRWPRRARSRRAPRTRR